MAAHHELHTHTYIASVVALYWFVSISMVYLNKALMSSANMSIPAPIFVTWFQCVVTAIICYACGKVGQRIQRNAQYLAVSTSSNNSDDDDAAAIAKKNSFWMQFPQVDYKVHTGKRVFPLSVVFVGMITFNNICLKWVEVSFYNVARSLTIVFNVVLSKIMLGSDTSTNTMACLGIVIIGFFIGSHGELNFSLWGTLSGVASSLFVSLNSIYTKKVLPVVDNDHWRLTFYNNMNACFLFIPLMLIFEHDAIMAAFSSQFLSALFWMAMMVAGFFGFAIGIVTVLQIKATSPLTHNISGTAKAAVQSMLAFYIWGNKPTFLGVLGIFTVLGGSLLYTMVKMNESTKGVVMASTKTSSDMKDLEMPPSGEKTT
jgi:solute carrier family 35 (GDP-fucose transporter), member C1